jgi:hypothetical protein
MDFPNKGVKMKHNFYLPLFVLFLSILACAFPASTPAAPTLTPIPPTPNPPLPSQIPATATSAAVSLFTGTWIGPDPDDGSVMTLTLVQTGSTLEGRYSDSYSGTITPPGYDGTVTGSVLSPTTAQVTMNLSRHDGQNIVLQANLALSGQDNILTATVTSLTDVGLWALTRE